MGRIQEYRGVRLSQLGRERILEKVAGLTQEAIVAKVRLKYQAFSANTYRSIVNCRPVDLSGIERLFKTYGLIPELGRDYSPPEPDRTFAVAPSDPSRSYPVQMPTGTVTFLFTDIEGSSKLWERYPEGMKTALVRHDRLLREAIEKHKGYVFKTMGDAFCAAFPTAHEALNAALNAQLVLLEQQWGETGPIRVRMALHTGEAETRDNDYFGPTLNRVARLQSVGYGQQTLISKTTYELVRNQLPEKTSLLDLDLHRLKDLSSPEHVWQLQHPLLPSQFPPLKSLTSLPNNLPRQLSSFIGREAELAEIKGLLRSAPLLTLTGTGGCGKTRLALQAAADLLEDYPDGVWFVEFAPLNDAALIPQTVSAVLGLREEAGQPLPDTLAQFLRSKRLLIILDNCEHLLAPASSLADTLLKACGDLSILATSREALNISGEEQWRVPPLNTPALKTLNLAENDHETAANLLQYNAVRLFVERARKYRPAFTISSENAIPIAQICYQLDGIPLAIELAAARIASLSIDQIAQRLDDRFKLLTGGSRTALPRQQTLRALIDWSYDLLPEEDRTLLARLSVFGGGCALEAVEAICSDGVLSAYDVLDSLTSLVAKSLVLYEEERRAARYRMLETVRQYACERLARAENRQSVLERYVNYYLKLAEEAEIQLTGAEQTTWLTRMEAEHDNVRAALAHAGEGEVRLRLANAMWRFWQIRGYLHEGRRWLEEARNDYAAAFPSLRAQMLVKAATLATFQGDHGTAHSLNQESLLLFRRLGDRHGIADALNSEGNVARFQNNPSLARALYEESLNISQELNDRRSIARALTNLGVVASDRGDIKEARDKHTESLAMFRELKDKQGVAMALNNVGTTALQEGDPDFARPLISECLQISRELGDQKHTAVSLWNLAIIAQEEGDFQNSIASYQQCLSIYSSLGEKHNIAACLEELARISAETNQYEQMLRLMGAAESLRQDIGMPLPERDYQDMQFIAAKARDVIGDMSFNSEFERGRTMTTYEAIKDALTVSWNAG